MNVETGMLKPGEARHPAESTQEIIAQDNVKAPEWAASEHYEYLGSEDIPKDRYIDPEFAKGEFEKMWTRTWQMACREDHIPEAGDYYVYDIGQYSFIVTRCENGDIRAHFNACLHRGTKLKPSGTAGFANDLK